MDSVGDFNYGRRALLMEPRLMHHIGTLLVLLSTKKVPILDVSKH